MDRAVRCEDLWMVGALVGGSCFSSEYFCVTKQLFFFNLSPTFLNSSMKQQENILFPPNSDSCIEMKVPSFISLSSSSLRYFANACSSTDPFLAFVFRGAVPKSILYPSSFSGLDLYISSPFSVVLGSIYLSVPRRDFVHCFPQMDWNIRHPPGNLMTTFSSSMEI